MPFSYWLISVFGAFFQRPNRNRNVRKASLEDLKAAWGSILFPYRLLILIRAYCEDLAPGWRIPAWFLNLNGDNNVFSAKQLKTLYLCKTNLNVHNKK